MLPRNRGGGGEGVLEGFSSYSTYCIGGTPPRLTNSCGATTVVNTDQELPSCTRFRAGVIEFASSGSLWPCHNCSVMDRTLHSAAGKGMQRVESLIWVLKALRCIKGTELLFLKTELMFRISSLNLCLCNSHKPLVTNLHKLLVVCEYLGTFVWGEVCHRCDLVTWYLWAAQH